MEAAPPPPSEMTMPDFAPPAAPARPRRGVSMPAWLAVLIVLVVAAGAGYAGWKLLAPAPPADLSQYDSNDGRNAYGGRATANGGRSPQRFDLPAQPPPIVEGVTLNPDGSGTAQTASFGVRFLSGAKPSLVAMNRLVRPPGEDAQALRARTQSLNETDARKAANVTDEQVAKLRAISFIQPPAVSPTTRKQLLDLWAALRAGNASARPAAEKAVLDAVRAADAANTAARTASTHAHAAEVRAILSADQIKQLGGR